MTSELTKHKCAPCEADAHAIKGIALRPLKQQLGEGWKVVDEHHLEKDYAFNNFKDALAFTNRVGTVAEEEGHHPDVLLTWGRVRLKLHTHSIDGLSRNDFILAAKADAVR